MRIALSVLALVPALPAAAQEAYRLPPPEVVELIDAAPAPRLSFAPDARHALVIERAALPSIEDLARRMLRLAGMRIDPAANASFRTSFDSGLSLRGLAAKSEVRVPLSSARLDWTRWSHDGRHFAFVLVGKAGSELWVASVDAPTTPVRLSDRLSTLLGYPQWMPDGTSLICRVVPQGRAEEPARSNVPKGPVTQESSGKDSPVRTYQDLLRDEHDGALFEHYAACDLVIVSVTGQKRQVAADESPALWATADPAPDGRHVLVARVQRPFSFLLPWYRFPQRVEVIDLEDGSATRVADVPLGDGIPIEGVRTGPRSFQWKAGHPATLVWSEALDGGDPRNEAEHRDRFVVWAAPFDVEPRELLRVEQRAWGISWFGDTTLALTREYDRERRWMRALLHDLSGAAPPRVLEDRSIRDRYGDPGSLLTRADDSGQAIVRQDGTHVWRAGSGASPEGLLPFLDRQDLESLETERVWRCAPGSYESLVALVDTSGPRPTFVTRHETKESPPNYRLRAPVEDGVVGDGISALTEYPDPQPALRGVTQELLTYARADGVPLSGTLYLPAGYEPGTRLPLFVWAYPREFNDPSTAGQVSASPWRFTRVGGISHLALLTQGWAVLDGATMPVIGDPETMNDTFIEQIVQAAEAAIQAVDAKGVCDPERVAVGGHSYGAFMTANLLAHSRLFRAGVARSGAYNRTLTPFGFQSERRSVWEAGETYFTVSPFLHADTIRDPLLLIHGMRDNNSGTFPMQSERMFAGVQGHGGTARLVMLPLESHGYQARESVLHVQAETIDWLQRHVVQAGARELKAQDAAFQPGDGK